jgi:hypothetical protein
MLDGLPRSNPAQDQIFLRQPVARNDERDRLSDDLGGGVTE